MAPLCLPLEKSLRYCIFFRWVAEKGETATLSRERRETNGKYIRPAGGGKKGALKKDFRQSGESFLSKKVFDFSSFVSGWGRDFGFEDGTSSPPFIPGEEEERQYPRRPVSLLSFRKGKEILPSQGFPQVYKGKRRGWVDLYTFQFRGKKRTADFDLEEKFHPMGRGGKKGESAQSLSHGSRRSRS